MPVKSRRLAIVANKASFESTACSSPLRELVDRVVDRLAVALEIRGAGVEQRGECAVELAGRSGPMRSAGWLRLL